MKLIHQLQDGITVYDHDGGLGVKLCESAGNEYVRLILQPGAVIPAHVLPIAVTFYVLRGKGRCTLDEVTYEATADDLIECPVGANRSWENYGTELLELLVIKRTHTDG